MLFKPFKALLAASIFIQHINAADDALRVGKCVVDDQNPPVSLYYCALSSNGGLYICDSGTVRYHKPGLWLRCLGH